MKIAIIGSGATGVLAAKHFYDIGAEVKLFSANKDLGGLLNYTDLSSLIDEDIKVRVINSAEFLSENQLVKNGRVVRVHKRFLPPDTIPENSSRFADLFRVVYQIDAKEHIEKSQSENDELYRQLDDVIIESLKTSIEAYEDFDVVIDCQGDYSYPLPMGAGGTLALNEKVIKDDERVFYGKDILTGLETLEKERNIVFVGSDVFSLIGLNKIKDYFFENEKLNLHIVCTESLPFEKTANDFSSLFAGFNELVTRATDEYESEIDAFNKKIMEWKELEDHIRVKSPRPAEPRMRLSIYNGAVVSSVDKLLDREGLFLTIEGSELLGSFNKLMTIGCDKIFVGTGNSKKDNFEKALDHDEKGYFKADCLESISEIENQLMKMFSKGTE